MKINHPLWRTLRSLKGNQRACVVTEPLWAIPNNLFLPFASIYMAAIGLQDVQIGMVASLGLAAQFLSGLLSGAIVDKYGRRRTMLVFGLLSWLLPCMLWAGAQGYWYFMFAAALNGMWRITGNSFSCMIVEDGDSGQLINIYTILNFFGLMAGFISPVAGLCIDRFTLVPTMRVIYLAAMILMAIKFVIQYRLAKESGIGLRRREECRGHSLSSLAFGGWGVFVSALRHTKLLPYVVLMTLMTCFNIVQATFWPLFVTASYGISASMLSVFPMVKAITTILVYLFITSHISMRSLRHPLLFGLGLQFLGLTVLLLCMPFAAASIWAVSFSAICEAFALAVLGPVTESMMSVAIPAKERARVNSLIMAMILLISIPVGWIAGQLSQRDRMLPLVMNIGLLLAEFLMVLVITRISREKHPLL
ncbi:MFS transporter [Anaerocolumna xylanovorans]|uniref:Fucose permease n=1 Tax=Anaerocolumna xylanovorans DSM 12503 TaxID=1121345 RepID=A0A1M7XW07_9FIRM|nr:MFS transporter [Anaerocolumna xylanovorans]SHO42918.1 Fucose permease [Anaerocolumna xylanovorans DSM 12503]